MLNLGDGKSVTYRDALTNAYNMLKSSGDTINSHYTDIPEKNAIIDYKVKLAYAWMDFAEKIK